jgi:hypothetical protein
MSWTFSSRGSCYEVAKAISKFNVDDNNSRQFDSVRRLVLDEIDRVPGNPEVYVEANGGHEYTTEKQSGYVHVTITINETEAKVNEG